jgi:hypothetical protein
MSIEKQLIAAIVADPELMGLLKDAGSGEIYRPLIGEYVIVRDDQAGVYAGPLLAVSPDGVTLGPGSRHIHYWAAGGSVAQVAERGIADTDTDSCRVTAPLSSGKGYAFQAQNVVQVIACTQTARERIEAMPVWTGGLDD